MPKQRPVFLVEDNPAVRSSLTEALRELSLARVVAYADNETEAIDWLAVYSDKVNLVILDIHLPSGSGFSILKQMRDAKLHHPIVVLTNHASPEIRQMCLATGATAFFDKAAEQNQFFDWVRDSK